MRRTTKMELKSQGLKKIIFYLVAFALPILFFLILEGCLRLFEYGDNLALFVPAPKEYPNHLMCNPSVGNRYFFMQSTVTRTPNDYFLKNKPSDSYRIFVMGASTAAGFPYGDALMFSRILQRRLQDTFPQRTIEVINTAMTAVNSYTLLDLLGEIIEQQPDALLLYAGHNEFYGALGIASRESLGKIPWFVNFYLRLQRFKVFIFLRNSISAVKKLFAEKEDVKLTATLMERIVKRAEIPFNSPIYRQGLEQYESNLSAIIGKAKSAGIPLLISELVSNLRDQPPFAAQDSSYSTEALRVYGLAQDLENERRFPDAKNAYRKAKDLDPIRFRAPEAFNEIIHKLQNEMAVVPMQRFFEENSANALIGDNLMIDHLHPNIAGCFLMADAFYQTMRKQGLITATWPLAYIKPSTDYRVDWAITAVDSSYVDLLIRHLKAGWPFKAKNSKNTVLSDFIPLTYADTLAEKVIYDELNLTQAHMQMAQYYRQRKELVNAEKEYNAMFQILNEDEMSYINRADILIAHHEHDKALKLLYKSIESHETPLALKRIGQIHLDFGRTAEAVPYLQRAYKLSPYDSHLVYLLARSYAATGRKKAAMEALNTLKSIDPAYQRIPLLEQMIGQGAR
jgi:lysophospholipase L1-like esterase